MSKNFKYLDDLIHSGVKEIVLDSNIVLGDGEEEYYGYKSDFDDNNHSCGIKIDVDDLIIDGNGHTIDAKEKSGVFMFTGSNIIIKNITIKNSVYSIENYNGFVTMINTCFTNNLGFGGALFNHCGELTIMTCKFIDNEARRDGGAILNRGEIKIIDSLFKGNDAYHWGGSIENHGKLDIKKSTFLNNFADYDGGAICNTGNLSICSSTFSNNVSGKNGGAIYSINEDLKLKDCTFKDNKPDDIYKLTL